MHKIESPPGSDTEEIVTVWPSMQDRSISFWYYGWIQVTTKDGYREWVDNIMDQCRDSRQELLLSTRQNLV